MKNRIGRLRAFKTGTVIYIYVGHVFRISDSTQSKDSWKKDILKTHI